MVNIDALLSEWAYRCKKGYPDLDSPSDLRVLKSILKEQGISLPEQQLSLFSEDEMAQMIKKDTGVDIKMIDNEKELERVFDKDFEEALKNAETLIGDRPVNFVAKQVLIEMVFQLGIGGVGKFKKMWSALDNEDYGEASFQMMDSLWAKQTPKRAAKLSAKMRSAKA
jgi:hypothetical protein